MPTYDYVCTECGFSQEVFQSIKDDSLTECPSCHRSSYRRRIGAGAGLIFRGSGFYLTDYKNSANGSGSSAKTTRSSSNTVSTPNATSSESTSSTTPPQSPSTPSKESE